MKETATLEVEIFRGRDGLHTCSSAVGEDCRFLVFTKMGFQPRCTLLNKNLDRRDGGLGYIEPICGLV